MRVQPNIIYNDFNTSLFILFLGWFRQCSVISHGKDMDIGMWIKDYNKQLIDEFQNNGLYLEHLFGRVKVKYMQLL